MIVEKILDVFYDNDYKLLSMNSKNIVLTNGKYHARVFPHERKFQIILKEDFRDWHENNFHYFKKLEHIKQILKSSLKMDFVHAEDILYWFNQVKEKYNVENPNELLNKIKNDRKSFPEISDSQVSRLLIVCN